MMNVVLSLTSFKKTFLPHTALFLYKCILAYVRIFIGILYQNSYYKQQQMFINTLYHPLQMQALKKKCQHFHYLNDYV
jgi:hypothetical protein